MIYRNCYFVLSFTFIVGIYSNINFEATPIGFGENPVTNVHFLVYVRHVRPSQSILSAFKSSTVINKCMFVDNNIRTLFSYVLYI